MADRPDWADPPFPERPPTRTAQVFIGIQETLRWMTARFGPERMEQISNVFMLVFLLAVVGAISVGYAAVHLILWAGQ